MPVKLTKQQMEAKLNLLEASKILQEGGTQSVIREKLGDVLGQKLWCILLLDRRFPSVKLVYRLTELESSDPLCIKFSAIKGSLLPHLVMRSDAKQLAEKNQKEKLAGRGEFSELTAKNLEDFLTGGTQEKSNQTKIMARHNIEAMVSQFPISIGVDMARAILTNNPDVLQKYLDKASLLNKVIEAVMD